MKRSPALTPLSHDHQHALDAALRLRRAEEETLDEAVENFARFFADEGRRHFQIEEELLVPALSRDDPDWDTGITRMLEDHAAIRADAEELRGTADVETARRLGRRLHDHVRFEERELFPLLEARLPADALERLGEAIAEAA